MFNLTPQPRPGPRYYATARSIEKSAWRSRRRAIRRSEQQQAQPSGN
jgi:hypothetical protein